MVIILFGNHWLSLRTTLSTISELAGSDD